jgi:hypothetical protein
MMETGFPALSKAAMSKCTIFRNMDSAYQIEFDCPPFRLLLSTESPALGNQRRILNKTNQEALSSGRVAAGFNADYCFPDTARPQAKTFRSSEASSIYIRPQLSLTLFNLISKNLLKNHHHAEHHKICV